MDEQALDFDDTWGDEAADAATSADADADTEIFYWALKAALERKPTVDQPPAGYTF